MNLDLADIGAVLFVMTPLALVLVRILAIPDGASLEDLFVPRVGVEWPSRVQEEEPVRWHVERLTPRDERVPERGPQPATVRPGRGPSGSVPQRACPERP